MSETTWTTTRAQLVDALCHLTAEVPLYSFPAGNERAGDVADALLAQLPRFEGDAVAAARLAAIRAYAEDPATHKPARDALRVLLGVPADLGVGNARGGEAGRVSVALSAEKAVWEALEATDGILP